MTAVYKMASKEVVQLLLEIKADITAVTKVKFNILSTCLQPDAECRINLFCCVTIEVTCLLRELSNYHALLRAGWKDCVDGRRGGGCEYRDYAAPPGQRRRAQYQRQR
jgi:hypothetical protein